MTPVPSGQTALLDPSAYPLLLPYVSCVENAVYFGGRYIISVTDAERTFLHSCNGSQMLRRATQTCGVSAEFVARVAWLLVWSPKPVRRTARTGDTVKRLVVCANPEDAWLALGGTLLGVPEKSRSRVVSCFTVFGGTPYTAAFPSYAETNLACRDEASIAAMIGGVDYEAWNIPEYDIRSQEEGPTSEAGDWAVPVMRAKFERVLDELAPDDVYVPAALANPVDGRIVLETALELFVEGTIPGNLHIFEDFPSTVGYRIIDEFYARFEGSYLKLNEYYVDVTEQMARKRQILSVFRCRIDGRRQTEWTASAARNIGDRGEAPADGAERCWNVSIGGIG